MKKTIFTLLISVVCFWTANAQITIDGDMADWNEVPILSEPGVFPLVKVMNDGINLNYMMNLGSTNTFNPTGNPWYSIDLYLDADGNSSTGQKSGWLYINSGNDYLVQGPELLKYTGTDGADNWDWLKIADATRAKSTDFHQAEISIAIADLTGVALGTTYNVGFPYYLESAPSTAIYFPANDWGFAYRKSFTMKPRTEVALSTSADFTSANAYYHPFTKDENIAQYIDFQSAAGAGDNPKQWASWAVNLTSPGSYDFKMTSSGSGSGKVQLALVDMTTNAVVKTFAEVWYPADAAMTENSYGAIDLSDVPAGRYMLKLTNPSAWDTFLKVAKISLSRTATKTQSLDAEKFSVKQQKNGLTVSSDMPMDIQIYNTVGQLVAAKNQTKNAAFRLSENMYIVKINSNGKVYSEKLIVK